MRLILAASLLMAVSLAAIADPVIPYEVEPRFDVNNDGLYDIHDVLTLQTLIQLGIVDLELDYDDDLELTWRDLVAWIHAMDYEVGDWDLSGGESDNTDQTRFILHYNRTPPPWRNYTHGDITCDGVVDSSDMVLLGQFNDDFWMGDLPAEPVHEDIMWAWLDQQL